MHLVLINQYFPPDLAPTGWMLEAVAEELVRAGHRVTVVCAAGVGYAGDGDVPTATSRQRPGKGPSVVRVGSTRRGRASSVGKLLDYLTYYLGVAWQLAMLQPRPDRLVALTTPPYLSVLARGLSKLRGADHAHWVMDLYPDVMVAHGMLQEGGVAQRILSSWARWGFGGMRRAALLTLGPDMAGRVEALVKTADPARVPSIGRRGVEWVPLWATSDLGGGDGAGTTPCQAGEAGLEDLARELRQRRGWAEDEIVVMYSGNMGLGHRFPEILEAVRVLATPVEKEEGGNARYRFVFHGRGKRRGEIEAFVRANPGLAVELHDYAPARELAAHLRSADVHLASLETSWTGTMLPSKAQGVFEAGRPLIVVAAADSSMARWVEESGGGWVAAPGDDAALIGALREASAAGERWRRGSAASEFARRNFSRRENAARCAAILARPRETDS